MANRLVSVDEDLNLPPEVQAQLTSNFENYFENIAQTAEASATTSAAAAQTSAENAALADSARVLAQQAAEEAQAPTQEMVDAATLPLRQINGISSGQYMTSGTGTNQATGLANALAAADAHSSKTLVIVAGEYIVDTPVAVPANVTVVGQTGTILRVTGDTFIFTASNNNTFRGLTFRGTNPVGAAATLLAQYAINCVGVGGARLSDLRVEGCNFEGIEYAAIRVRFTDRFNITGNRFFDTGYSGVQIGSAADGVVEGNFFRGTGVLPSYAVNSYAVSISLGGGVIDPVNNPQPQNIRVCNNTVTNQAWEAIDTHGGTEITFSNNTIYGCESGLIAVIRGGVVGTAPQHVVMVGNNIDGGNFPLSNRRFGIAINGEQSGPTQSRAVVTGNSISNMGIAREHPAQWSPAGASIMLTNMAAVTVSGNNLHNSLGHGISMKNVAAATVGTNMIDGVWRQNGDTTRFSSAIYLSDHTGVALIDSNVLTGGAGLTNPNERAIQQVGTGVGTVRDTNNFWGAVPNENVDTGWPSYTPSLAGITLGNGSIVARWARSGNGNKTITATIVVTAGTTTSITGTVELGLPTPARTASHVVGVGSRTSSNGVVGLRGNGTTSVFVLDASTGTAWGTGTSFASGATLRVSLTYEAA